MGSTPSQLSQLLHLLHGHRLLRRIAFEMARRRWASVRPVRPRFHTLHVSGLLINKAKRRKDLTEAVAHAARLCEREVATCRHDMGGPGP